MILHRWETQTRNPQSFGPGYSFGFPHIRQPRALFTHSFILATLISFLRVPVSTLPLLMFRAISCFLQMIFGSSGLLFQARVTSQKNLLIKSLANLYSKFFIFELKTQFPNFHCLDIRFPLSFHLFPPPVPSLFFFLAIPRRSAACRSRATTRRGRRRRVSSFLSFLLSPFLFLFLFHFSHFLFSIFLLSLPSLLPFSSAARPWPGPLAPCSAAPPARTRARDARRAEP